MLTVKQIHLELTNTCVLKCPRCARTKFLEAFPQHWKNASLTLDDLKKFIDVPITGLGVLFCGNYGDPIYNKELHEITKWLKDNGAHVTLITNGSYKTQEWWQQLVGIMDGDDTIIFSVDGTPDNFTNYRINADWQSIEVGMRVVGASSVRSVWSYIPFSYNSDSQSIATADRIRKELGIDEFVISPSDRWDSADDEYKPINFVGSRELAHSAPGSASVSPNCKTGELHFVTATGHYAPCCFAADHRFYYKTPYGKKKTNFDIREHTLTEILNTDLNAEFMSSVFGETPPSVCRYNCPK